MGGGQNQGKKEARAKKRKNTYLGNPILVMIQTIEIKSKQQNGSSHRKSKQMNSVLNIWDSLNNLLRILRVH